VPGVTDDSDDDADDDDDDGLHMTLTLDVRRRKGEW